MGVKQRRFDRHGAVSENVPGARLAKAEYHITGFISAFKEIVPSRAVDG